MAQAARRGGRHPWDALGHPYPVAEHGREDAVRLYRERLRARPDLVAEVRARLAGRDLACWCGPEQDCHAEILLSVAAGAAP